MSADLLPNSSHTKSSKPRVLLVDDDPSVLQAFTRQLRRQYAVSTAPDAAIALALLEDNGPFAVVVSDLQMPGKTGIELLAEVQSGWPDTVRMLLTGRADLETALAAINRGMVFRYLTKPCSSLELVDALVAGVEHYELLVARQELTRSLEREVAHRSQVEQELRQANAVLESLARTDALTGLLNRRAFNDRGEREIKRAARYGSPLSALLIDLDHFKRINDVYGHLAGDAVLSDVGTLLTRVLRDVDVVCRWGGEEFCVLLPETTLERAQQVASRLLDEIRRLEVIVAPDVSLMITCSIGVAGHDGDHDELTTLINNADRAVYAAKAAGRDRLVVEATLDAEQRLTPGDRH